MRKTIDYAVADIHGRADLLLPLIVACHEDATVRGALARFIFIGDVIDRGPRSRDCLDMVSEILATRDGSVYLRGNHEDMALVAFNATDDDEDLIGRWLGSGGMNTLTSYHPDPDIGFDMMRTLHTDHLRLMANSVTSTSRSGYFFAHAGIDPNRRLSEQTDRDLMSTRGAFLDHVGLLEQVVIHGHEIVGDRPVVTENRISIDTGAYRSGRLTACAVDGGEVRFMQTDGSGRRVIPVEPIRLDRGMGTCLDVSFAMAA